MSLVSVHISLEDEVLCLVGETSDKYVPQPSGDDIITDAVNGLRRFKDNVRWKDFHRQLQEEKDRRMGLRKTKEEKGKEKDGDTTEDEQNDIVEESKGLNEGLGTGLKPTNVNLSAPRLTGVY